MKKYIWTCLLFMSIGIIPVFSQLQTGQEIAVTETESGKVRGLIRNGIYTYKGIPYAKAERFEAPQKAESWEGVRSSMTWGPVAPLVNPTSNVQDESEFVFDHDWGYSNEDCLVLNIWTPGIQDGKKRPVMFWIHGGGFTSGSSQELPSTHGENLAKKGDVVVVSINHRLNVLGFLDLSAYGEAYQYSANHSLLDIRVAMEWVKENISSFGGDPDNVTIFGQSGGGAKVNTLMAMPSAKGLFHRAVNHSGSYITSLQKKEVSQDIAKEVLKELSISENEVSKLKEVSFRELADAGKKALKTVENRLRADGVAMLGFGLDWMPSVDGKLLPYDIFSEEALELSKDIPLLVGTVKNEFMASLFLNMPNASEQQVRGLIQMQQGEKTEDFIAAVKEAYPDDTHPTDLMDVDAIFRPGAVYQANEKSEITDGASVYMYLFSWQSPVMDGKYKAVHCMELPFVFDNIDRAENMTGGGEEAHVLADKVSQAWINFARTGNPNHAKIPVWEAYTSENGTTMFFDNECQVRHHHDKAFMEIVSKVP
ncbi:MAG: carboxylesterase/lipase family protein [Bacteroidota bacterium]